MSPPALDPADFILAHGPDAYKRCLATAPDWVTWLVARARQQFDFTTTEGKGQAVEFLLRHVHRIQDHDTRFETALLMVRTVLDQDAAWRVYGAGLALIEAGLRPANENRAPKRPTAGG